MPPVTPGATPAARVNFKRGLTSCSVARAGRQARSSLGRAMRPGLDPRTHIATWPFDNPLTEVSWSVMPRRLFCQPWPLYPSTPAASKLYDTPRLDALIPGQPRNPMSLWGLISNFIHTRTIPLSVQTAHHERLSVGESILHRIRCSFGGIKNSLTTFRKDLSVPKE